MRGVRRDRYAPRKHDSAGWAGLSEVLRANDTDPSRSDETAKRGSQVKKCAHCDCEDTWPHSCQTSLKARISSLEAELAEEKRLCKLALAGAAEAGDYMRAFESALREIASYQGPDSALDINAKHMRDAAREALGPIQSIVNKDISILSAEKQTPVSTLCAVCDQIKELHPATHPWTARETSVESQQPDIYAAHSADCYLRKYREGYCDCELPSLSGETK